MIMPEHKTIDQLMKEARPTTNHVERVTKRLDLLVATVTVIGAQWLIDHGHPYFGWSLLVNNLVTGLYIIVKETRS